MKSKFITGLALAVSISSQAQFNPVALTPGSFTFSVVVPSNAPQILPYCITATSGSGTSEGDNTYFEQGYYARSGVTGSNLGVPPHNTIFTNINNSSCTFLMPPTYLTNNDLQVDSSHTSGTFVFTTPTAATSLAILSGGAGAGTVNYSVNHVSGSPETGTLSLSDWFTPGSAQIAWGANARVSSGNSFDVRSTSSVNNVFPYLYSYYLSIANTNPITSLTITWAAVNEGNFYAVSGANGSSTYTPIPVQGFNQKTTVPAYDYPTYPVTANMDNGTNLLAGGNTWFEQGYYTPATGDGLPPSGSTFASSTQPTHHYQMGNYQSNCGVLIDANHKSNNIVPASPKPYTSFAFLTAGGNVGTGKKMTNICILQHQGGINETNQFIGYDWFESTVPNSVAFTANGRFDLNGDLSPNGCSFNTIGGGNPKLFETYFTLTDTNDTVTNIIVEYGLAPGGNSTTFIMAVSASAGGVAPLINSGPLPATQSWFVGQTATFTVSIAGTQPITSIWEVENNGVYVPLTNGVDANGSTISGANTPVLTINNVQLGDATNYEYVASNVVGSATSGSASLTVSPDSAATAVTIVSQSPPASVSTLAVFTNITAELSVTVNAGASPPINYQWYSGVPQVPGNAIPGATNAGYVFSNLYGVTLSCIVSNIGGTATSSPIAITLKSPIASPSPYQAALFGYNPVGYWPLDESSGTVAYDLVGNNNGTYTGSFTLNQAGVSSATGLGSSSSAGFDGFTAYVDIPVNDLNITGPITVIAWVQTSYAGSVFETVLGHSDSGYRIDIDPAAYGDGGNGNMHFADEGPDISGPNPVNDGNWHQLVGVYDGTFGYIYVDGELANSGTETAPSGSLDDVWIGAAPDYPGARNYSGNIAQVSIINSALTGAEVTALYGVAYPAPVTGTFALGAVEGVPTPVSVAKIASVATSSVPTPAFSITSVSSPTTNGAIVTLSGTPPTQTLTYTSFTNLNTDTINYVLSDGFQTAPGTIQVEVVANGTGNNGLTAVSSGANLLIQAFGIPGQTYYIQQSLNAPGLPPWTDVGTAVGSPAGQISFLLIGPPPGASFYRTSTSP
jgi:hypothetical protein